MSDEEGKGFKVTDRRSATAEEQAENAEPEAEAPEEEAPETPEAPVEEAPETPEEETPEAPEGEGDEGAEEAPADAADAGHEPMPISFATFVLSLGESAMVHLGVVPNPVTGEAGADLRTARQTIDILGILEEKTRGNLEDDESRLLTSLLYNLRMKFIQAQSGGKE